MQHAQIWWNSRMGTFGPFNRLKFSVCCCQKCWYLLGVFELNWWTSVCNYWLWGNFLFINSLSLVLSLLQLWRLYSQNLSLCVNFKCRYSCYCSVHFKKLAFKISKKKTHENGCQQFWFLIYLFIWKETVLSSIFWESAT